jgi:hypothetical protein
MIKVSYTHLTLAQDSLLAKLQPHCDALRNACAFNCDNPSYLVEHIERAETIKDKAVAILLYIIVHTPSFFIDHGHLLTVELIKSLQPDDILRLTSSTWCMSRDKLCAHVTTTRGFTLEGGMFLKKPCLRINGRSVYVTDLETIFARGPDKDLIAHDEWHDKRNCFDLSTTSMRRVTCEEGTFEGIDVEWTSPSLEGIPSQYRYVVSVIVGWKHRARVGLVINRLLLAFAKPDATFGSS